jgi:hypothetical protein
MPLAKKNPMMAMAIGGFASWGTGQVAETGSTPLAIYSANFGRE